MPPGEVPQMTSLKRTLQEPVFLHLITLGFLSLCEMK